MTERPTAPDPARSEDPQRAGERLAKQERRLRLLLVHLAGSAVRARVEIDDLVQEVYLRALGSYALPPAPEDDEAGDPALWRFLARLARNAVIDAARAIRAARRDGRTTPLAHGDWSRSGPRASQLLAATWGPATRVAANELEQELEVRFRALDPEHRRVIGLRQFRGLSARETAERMGRSETAVHSLYRRALSAWQAEEIVQSSRDESDADQRS